MTPIQLAKQYMDCFYGEAPLDSMEPLLADDLTFQGPFYTFDSAKDYLDSLKAAPPSGVSYKLLKIYEADNSVCFIYLFSKPGVETLMAQTFDVREGKINSINLIFDTNAFS